MKKDEINDEYPSIDTSNIFSEDEMEAVLGGDCSCKQGCATGCKPGFKTSKETNSLEKE